MAALQIERIGIVRSPSVLRIQEIGLSVVLAIQVAIVFVAVPLAATRLIDPLAVDAFRFGLTAVAVVMITRTRLTAGIIIVAFALSVILSLRLPMGLASTATYLFRLGATTVFDLAVAAAVARAAFGGGRVTVHRIMGAVILYLSIGLIFANAYRACDLVLGHAFKGLPADRNASLSQLLYFSLSTLTTTGFGDIAPLHPFVRSLANLEAVIGQLFPATLLARLVTQHAAGDKTD